MINPLTAASQGPRNAAFRRLSVSVPCLLSIWRPAQSTRTARADKFVATLRKVVAEMSETLRRTLEPQMSQGI